MAYVEPQVLVFQEFNTIPDEITEPLRAHISGGHAKLFRYSDADEKQLIDLGAYDPDNDMAYLWPNRPAGAIVDQDYTKLFLEDAKLVLFEDLLSLDETVAPVVGKTNRIRRTGTGGFRENVVGETTYARIAELYDRDVKNGDRVYIRGVVDSVEYELETYVLNVVGEIVAAIVGEAEEDAANLDDQAADTTITQTAGTDNDVVLTADVSGYNGLPDGYVNDTYTLTVIQGSVGGDYSTAEVRLESASGLDDEDGLTPDTTGNPFDAGARGLTLTFTGTDDLVAGQIFRVEVEGEFESALARSGGTYSGTTDTTYILEVTRGGVFGAADVDDRPQITVRTVHGVDSSRGPVRVDNHSTDVAVGTKGVTVQFYGTGADSSSGSLDPVTGLRKGDLYYIDVTAEGEGRMSTLVLAHNMPDVMLEATDLDLQIYLLQDIEIPENREGFDPLVNFETSATEFTVISGLIAYEDSWTDGGVPLPIVIESATVFVEYRCWLQTWVGEIGTITPDDDIDELIPGASDPDNPLKWGVIKALANSNGTAVKFTAVSDPTDPDAWSTDVLSPLVGADGIYSLVPLTTDAAVLTLFQSHISAQSSAEAGRWRKAFFYIEDVTEVVRTSAASSTDDEEVLATIADDPDTSGTQYTLLTIASGNGNFVTDEVEAGDTVRFLFGQEFGVDTYETFTVDAVINEETLRLTSGPDAAVGVAQKVEVWHTYSKTERAEQKAAKAASYSSRRVCAVHSELNLPYHGMFVCAALAGLRSGVVPHQGLTRLEIAGLADGDPIVSPFNSSHLNTMAESGVWIVTVNADGAIHTRHATTTDVTDVNSREEMVVANVDSMSFLFQRRLEPYIGRSNVTPGTLSMLRVELTSAIEFLKSNGFVDRLGGQLIDGTITELRAHTLLADRVVAVLALEIPYPLNLIELYLVV